MRKHFRSRRTSVGLAVAVLAGSVVVADPAMASPDGAIIAISDAAGLQVAVQQDGSNSWSLKTVPTTAGWSWSSPSLTFQPGFGDNMLTAVRGDGSLWMFWQATVTSQWNAQEVAGPNSAYFYAQPAIVAENTSLGGTPYEMIVAENADGLTSTFYWQAFQTNTWSHEALPTETGVAKQPDIALTANESKIVVSYVDSPQGSSGEESFGIDELPFNMSGWSEMHVNTGMTDDVVDLSLVVQPNTGNLLVGAANDGGRAYFFWSPTITSWNEEDIASGGEVQNYGNYIQPLAITGNEQGVIEGVENSAGTCDSAIAQADGPHPWVSEPMSCPGGYPNVPVIEDEPGTDDEIAAIVVGGGGAYYYWQPTLTTTWNKETITGVKDVAYYTQPAVLNF